MKLVEQSVQLLEQDPTLEGAYKLIELAGRTCYKSEDKITEDSAKAFVQRMIDSHHCSMLEHGTVYLSVPLDDWNQLVDEHDFRFYDCPYVQWGKEIVKGMMILTTSLRVLVDYHYMDLLKYAGPPTKAHVRRYTFKCTTNIHVYKDLTRHRKMSFAIESTRFCNYSKDKFGDEITFIAPCYTTLKPGVDYHGKTYNALPEGDRLFLMAIGAAEAYYMDLLKEGWKPEVAADVLPQSTKADMVITGFEDDWEHLFDLRYHEITGKVHPQVKELATMMYEQYEKAKEAADTETV